VLVHGKTQAVEERLRERPLLGRQRQRHAERVHHAHRRCGRFGAGEQVAGFVGVRRRREVGKKTAQQRRSALPIAFAQTSRAGQHQRSGGFLVRRLAIVDEREPPRRHPKVACVEGVKRLTKRRLGLFDARQRHGRLSRQRRSERDQHGKQSETGKTRHRHGGETDQGRGPRPGERRTRSENWDGAGS